MRRRGCLWFAAALLLDKLVDPCDEGIDTLLGNGVVYRGSDAWKNHDEVAKKKCRLGESRI